MNRIIHFEFGSPDPEKTLKFYGDVFGWKFNQFGGEEYWLATSGEQGEPGINGGIMRSKDGQPRTVNVIGVSSVDDFAKKVTDGGGEVVVPKMPIPGVGYVAYCTDPTGVLFGIYHEDQSAK